MKIKKKKNLTPSVGPEIVLLMRRGRTIIDKKKQASKIACRKKPNIKDVHIIAFCLFVINYL